MLNRLIFLDEEDVVKIHDMILSQSPGLPGLSKERSLNSALHRIDNHINYHGTNDVYEIAALYAISIAQGHPFIDGNKRTAMICMSDFLRFNSICLIASNKDIEQMMVDIAEKKINLSDLTLWLNKYSITVEQFKLALETEQNREAN